MPHESQAVAFDIIETCFSLNVPGQRSQDAGLDRSSLQLRYAKTLRDGIALSMCGEFKPEQVALVAARAWDCQGAKSAGMTTGWVRRSEAEPNPALARPDGVGDNLLDVAKARMGARARKDSVQKIFINDQYPNHTTTQAAERAALPQTIRTKR